MQETPGTREFLKQNAPRDEWVAASDPSLRIRPPHRPAPALSTDSIPRSAPSLLLPSCDVCKGR
ncbi:hypothetical protein KIN20_003607 [Parelaphostrongylus tenuis]|uniref:Uncharacterized protein n=1 Tax=Parelaphostrongylus tenuis TaxID=148309 RepID=A0AAD5MQ54_PARTN|nr:hypothetical protein KIN20_003607 [Parelaphostrongylus tenuis]